MVKDLAAMAILFMVLYFIIQGDGNRARGNDNDIYGSNHIAIGSGNRITGNAVGWVGNGLQMFGVNAHPQFAAGQEVFFADLPNYKGPGAGVATNQQVYNYLDSRWRY